MNMTQLVLGCALGFIVAQGLMYGLRRLIVAKAKRKSATPAAPGAEADEKSVPLSYVRAFIRYAAPVFASAAFVLLGAWTLQDYLSAKSARAAVLEVPDPVVIPEPQAASQAAAALAEAEMAAKDAKDAPDPYADTEFKIPRRARNASLTDKLVLRAEQKARVELLWSVRQHAQRSQYDCEAVEHVAKYLKAGLDVWGFTTWQDKYFPVENYQGATLPQCQQIQSALDPSRMNLKSTVAQSAHP